MTVATSFDLSGLRSSAVIIGPWRVRLDRAWRDDLPPLAMGMLNPSTADHEVNDPTITRVIGRAQRGGFGSVSVWNLFAFRATDPDEMMAAADPVGPDNDNHIRAILTECRDRGGTAVVGWGVHGAFRNRDKHVLAIAREVGVPLFCLGTTKEGHPRHPLYVPTSQPLVPWRAAA